MWRQKSIQFGSRKRVAELIVAKQEQEARQMAARGERASTFEVCQVMYERDPSDLWSSEFAYSDADFSLSTFKERRDKGRKDMRDAIVKATPFFTEEDGFEHAQLYRWGTYRKYAQTDREEAARRHSDLGVKHRKG
jgi:hypothetical protein